MSAEGTSAHASPVPDPASGAGAEPESASAVAELPADSAVFVTACEQPVSTRAAATKTSGLRDFTPRS